MCIQNCYELINKCIFVCVLIYSPCICNNTIRHLFSPTMKHTRFWQTEQAYALYVGSHLYEPHQSGGRRLSFSMVSLPQPPQLHHSLYTRIHPTRIHLTVNQLCSPCCSGTPFVSPLITCFLIYSDQCFGAFKFDAPLHSKKQVLPNCIICASNTSFQNQTSTYNEAI